MTGWTTATESRITHEIEALRTEVGQDDYRRPCPGMVVRVTPDTLATYQLQIFAEAMFKIPGGVPCVASATLGLRELRALRDWVDAAIADLGRDDPARDLP